MALAKRSISFLLIFGPVSVVTVVFGVEVKSGYRDLPGGWDPSCTWPEQTHACSQSWIPCRLAQVWQ